MIQRCKICEKVYIVTSPYPGKDPDWDKDACRECNMQAKQNN